MMMKTENNQNMPELARVSVFDPIVAEVWAIKTEINRDANYDLKEIIRRARQVTIDSARANIGGNY